MTTTPGFGGAVFGSTAEGDGRSDAAVRRAMGEQFGVPVDWAWVHQVHGTGVVEATRPGLLGDADAMFTSVRGLTLAVATADCLPVVLDAEGGVGIAHAGWRGVADGVVPALLEAMAATGLEVRRAAIGPGIGACCFEVGAEVLDRLPAWGSTTTWGTPSVDLAGVVADQLGGVDVTISEVCTRTDERFHSHRRDRTADRQMSLAWLPG